MGLLRRRGRDHGPPAPAWAGAFSAEQFAAFTAAVEAALRARGLQSTMGDGFVQLDGAHGGRVLGLTPLAEQCLSVPSSDWPTVVDAHLAEVLDQGAAPGAGASPPLGRDEALAALRVRLDPRVEDDDATALRRRVCDGLSAVLVVQEGGRLRAVDEADADRWDQSSSALWERAQANTKAAQDLHRSTLTLEGGVEVTVVTATSPVAASAALWPEDVVGDGLGPAGALVAVPTRHTLMVHAIRHLGVVEGMRHLLPLVVRRHAEGPEPLSDQLYWWHAGTLTLIGSRVDGDWVSVTPPAELVAALNALPPPGAAPA